MGWYPCTCCCIKIDDPFTRSDDTDIGSKWEEVDGDWEIDTNRLVTSDANAVALTTATGTDDDFSVTAAIDFSPRYANVIFPFPEARIIFAYVDASNYWYVKLLNFGTNNAPIELHQVSGGSDSGSLDSCSHSAKPASESTLPSPVVIRVCRLGDLLWVTTSETWTTDAPSDPWTGFTYDVTGEDLSGRWGVGTGTLTDGAAGTHDFLVDRFKVHAPKTSEKCPACAAAELDCTYCDCSSAIKGWVVELSGFDDGAVSCTGDCDRINGEYIVDTFPDSPDQCYATAVPDIDYPNAGLECDDAHVDCDGDGAEPPFLEVVIFQCSGGRDPAGTLHVGAILYAMVQLRLGHCGGADADDQIVLVWWTILASDGDPDADLTAHCVDILNGADMQNFQEAPAYWYNASGGCLSSNPTRPYELLDSTRICDWTGAPTCTLRAIL